MRIIQRKYRNVFQTIFTYLCHKLLSISLPGVPEMMAKMTRDVKPAMVIEQNGDDFTVKVETPLINTVYSFTTGKEAGIIAVDWRKSKVI